MVYMTLRPLATLLGLLAAACVVAQTPLPAADLAKLRLSLRSMDDMNPNSGQYEVGGTVTNNSDWEIASIEMEFIDKTHKPWYRARFTANSFSDTRIGLKGNLLPKGRAEVTGVVAVPGDDKHTYWAEIVGATGYPGPDPNAMKGGLLAEITRGKFNAQRLKDASPETISESALGCDLLSLAVLGDNAELAAQLLKNGSDPNRANSAQRLPLDLAAVADASRVIPVLVKGGAKVEGDGGETPLEAACKGGSSQAVIALLKAGAKFDILTDKHTTLLHFAAKSECSYDALASLVHAGIPVNYKNDFGDTPLHYAANYLSPNQVGYLVRLGADIKLVSNTGKDALHMAAGKNNAGDTVVALLKSGADTETIDNDGRTALHIATLYKHPESIEPLLKGGADIAHGDSHQNTALHLASKNNYVEIVQLLVKAGAPLEARNQTGATALIYAAAANRILTTKELIALGANINAVDNHQSTALHEAVKGKGLAAVRALVKAGASKTARDDQGQTPVDLARTVGDADILKALGAG